MDKQTVAEGGGGGGGGLEVEVEEGGGTAGFLLVVSWIEKKKMKGDWNNKSPSLISE